MSAVDHFQHWNSHCKAENELSPTTTPTPKWIFMAIESCEDLPSCVNDLISLCQQCLPVKRTILPFAWSNHCSMVPIQPLMPVSTGTQRYTFTMTKSLQKHGLPAPNLHKGGVCLLEGFTDKFYTSALQPIGRVAIPHQYEYAWKHNTKKTKFSSLKYPWEHSIKESMKIIQFTSHHARLNKTLP